MLRLRQAILEEDTSQFAAIISTAMLTQGFRMRAMLWHGSVMLHG
jgi:hypothetical protein